MFGIVDLISISLFVVSFGFIVYNLPILAIGIRNAQKNANHQTHVRTKKATLFSFSIIVPVRNEENTLGRLVKALSNLSYPKQKVEIIIVESGSNDNTLKLCEQHAKEYGNIRVLKQPNSNGKASALNLSLNYCKGDIVGVFDADNVPEPNALMKAAQYFMDPKVAAVQGKTTSINAMENILTRLMSYEELVQCEALLRGKDSLGLFVQLRGSCQFIRRELLQQLSGFDESCLAEDLEISARIAEKGYSIRYGGDVCAWQESVSTLKSLFKQRARWSRGTMEVAFKYGRLMKKPSMRNFDAEMTLCAPFLMLVSLLYPIAASGSLLASSPFDVFWQTLNLLPLISTGIMLLLAGSALFYVSTQKRKKNLLWLPFVFGFCCLQAFVALYALILILLRRPRIWLKTEKKGTIANSSFDLQQC